MQTERTEPKASPRSTTRMSGEERRAQIVRVATRLFAERGFRGTTTREIAQAAGVSEAMIFRHFATKQDLYRTIIDAKACSAGSAQACGQFDAKTGMVAFATSVEGAADERRFFMDLARHFLECHEQDVEFLRLLLYSALEGREFFRLFWEQQVLPMANFMRAHVQEQQRAGAIRSDLHPHLIGSAFIGMIMHRSLVDLIFDPERSLFRISTERAARDYTTVLFEGIAASAKTSKGAESSAMRSEKVRPERESSKKRKQQRTSKRKNQSTSAANDGLR